MGLREPSEILICSPLYRRMYASTSAMKCSMVVKQRIKKRDLAHAGVFDYTEVLYDRQHRRSHLGGVGLEAFEAD